tara:strand:- start:6054 stop:6674 length:621 start_codon:yes stop_codon:yes gene_type:complete
MDKGPVIFRLISGESVIGTIVSENETEYTINRPYSINAMLMGDSPINSKEVVFLRDWLKFSIDLTTKLDKSNVLQTSVADPKMIEMYERKMESDDMPSNQMEDLVKDIMKDINKSIKNSDLSELFERTEEQEMMEKLYSLEMPLTEDFLSDLQDLIDVHMDEIDESNKTNNHPESIDEKNPYNKDRNPDDFGMDWRDWSPFPDDYT